MGLTSNLLKKRAGGYGGRGGGFFLNSPIQNGKPADQDSASIDRKLKELQAAKETQGIVTTPVAEQGTQGHQAPWQVYHDYPLSREEWSNYDPKEDPSIMNNPKRRHYGLPSKSERMSMVGSYVKFSAKMLVAVDRLPCCGGYHNRHEMDCPVYQENFDKTIEMLKALPKRSDFKGQNNLLYHGTSSIYVEAIRQRGLEPHGGKVYLTKNHWVAATEADYTVEGEEFNDDIAPTSGVGGDPVIVVLDAAHPSLKNLKVDAEYHFEHALFVTHSIPPEAILRIEDGFGKQIASKRAHIFSVSLAAKFLANTKTASVDLLRMASSGRYNIGLFNYNKSTHTLVAEASDLGEGSWSRQIYPDSIDRGITIIGKNGSAVDFVIEEEIRDEEGELLSWVLKPTADSIRKVPAARGIVVELFND